MWALSFVAFCTLYLAQATRLTVKLVSLDLHAKLGDGLPELNSLPTLSEPIDLFVTAEAEKYTLNKLRIWDRKPYHLQKLNYNLHTVKIPGLNITALKLKDIEVAGLSKLQSFKYQWRMATNRFDFNVSFPHLTVDVTADLTNNAASYIMRTMPRFSVRLMNVNISAAVQYNIGKGSNRETLFIDKADVYLHAKESMISINTIYGLEELRYLLAEVFNNSLDDVMDVLLKEVIHGINEELLFKIKPRDITKNLSNRVPSDLKHVPLDINRV